LAAVRLPRYVPGVRNALLACLLGACVALAGCDRSVAHEVDHARIPADLHSHVKLGTTTEADVEKLFGAPDQKAEDGGLVYEEMRTRPSGKKEKETTTFRFQGGVLHKVCQSRS
jgi:hypothetical protein